MRLRAVVAGMVILLVGSFILAACGGDDDDSSSSGSGSGSGTEVAARGPPRRPTPRSRPGSRRSRPPRRRPRLRSKPVEEHRGDARRQDRAGAGRRSRARSSPTTRTCTSPSRTTSRCSATRSTTWTRPRRRTRPTPSAPPPTGTWRSYPGMILPCRRRMRRCCWRDCSLRLAEHGRAGRDAPGAGLVVRFEGRCHPAARRRPRRPSTTRSRSSRTATPEQAFARGEGRLPQPLRVRRDPVAGRRTAAHLRRRDEVRRDPRADQLGRVRGRDPRRTSSSCAA